MSRKKLVKKSVLFVCTSLFFGCVGNSKTTLYPKVNSLAQERLFLRDKPFVRSDIKPTIPFPLQPKTRGVMTASVATALIGTIAPKLIDTTVDIVGKSIVALSGKNDESITIGAEFSNFFYKNSTYNLTSPTRNPAFNLLFISGEFGDEAESWRPKGFDTSQESVFKTLHLVGKPNFYMEAKVFPVPGNQYMEIVPTYIFYNRQFNSKGLDDKRDLSIHFSFYDLNDKSKSNLISEGSLSFRDVQVGKEYTSKELADVRTTFIEMPTISADKKGYSGGYRLNVTVTETRDINEWLASLGETISNSKDEITSKLYVSEEDKIDRETDLAKAAIQVEIVEARLEEAKANGMSKADILRLKSELLDKKAEANKEALKAGKSKMY
jgi:hypothetical protein